MSKLIFIHEDSHFANIWKDFGTENMAQLMNTFPFEKAKEMTLKRFFIPANQPDVDEWGFPKNDTYIKMRDPGRKTVLSGMEYRDLILYGKSIARSYIGLNNKICHEPINIDAYDAPKYKMQELDEISQWVSPIWKLPSIKLEKYISILLHTDKAFDADYNTFTQWLKDRLKFKRMDRYDLSRNNFYSASRRYGVTFADRTFTTY